MRKNSSGDSTNLIPPNSRNRDQFHSGEMYHKLIMHPCVSVSENKALAAVPYSRTTAHQHIPMSAMHEHSADDSSSRVRALAAYDRESEQHKKIYEDLKEE